MISLKLTFDTNESLSVDIEVPCNCNCFLDPNANTANIHLSNLSNGEQSLKPIAIQFFNKNINSVELYRNGTLIDSLVKENSKIDISWSLYTSNGEEDDFQETLAFTKKIIN